MTVETLNYDEFITRGCTIKNVTVTIKAGQTLPRFTPLIHEAATGHYVAVAAAGTKAQFLTAFDVDTTGGAKEHSVISEITIDPAAVSFPVGMTEQVKSGLFAGTPISLQSPNPF